MAGVQAAGSGSLAAERIVVRRCQHDHELQACVELQKKEVWGFTNEDLIPLRLFIVAQKIGGQVLGALTAEIYEWKASPRERGRAAQVQTVNRQALMSTFSRGLAALGYSRDEQGKVTFLLGNWDEAWSYES